MATLTTQAMGRAGLTPTTVAAAGGGDAAETGRGNSLYINNGGGAPITVTIAVPTAATAFPGLTYTNNAITVTNGTFKLIPLPPEYRDPTTGLATITYSAVTTVTVAVIQNTTV
jgi:hypothetical protein